MKEKTSALWLYGCERATSGAMYRSDPVRPVRLRISSSSPLPMLFFHSLHNPKSARMARLSEGPPVRRNYPGTRDIQEMACARRRPRQCCPA